LEFDEFLYKLFRAWSPIDVIPYEDDEIIFPKIDDLQHSLQGPIVPVQVADCNDALV